MTYGRKFSVFINYVIFRSFYSQVGSLEDKYVFARDDHVTRSKRAAHHHTRALQRDLRVCTVDLHSTVV